MKLLLALLCIVCLWHTCSGQENPIERFDITVVASFRPDAGGVNCDYCDCPSPDCTWIENFTCPNATFAVFGPDDTQQRWGNAGTGYNCFDGSGVGFQGVTNVPVYSNLAAENITRIGRITHYNNVINGESPTALRLTLTVTAPQLAQPFVIAYPLLFIETLNDDCDPAIQRTTVECDDRFSFEQLYVRDSFLYNNVEYTLEVVGFLNSALDLNEPLKQFVTQETAVSRADVFARIVTFCIESSCGPNEIFIPLPTCSCECGVTNATCQAVFGPDWIKDPDSCNCLCARDVATCSPGAPLNIDTCGCGCNVTEAYCASLNPTFGVAVAPACACDCKKQKFLDCYFENEFYVPDQEAACQCVCRISDGACERKHGDGWTADFVNCLCNPPDDDGGLTGGDIAGIVIGSTAGALLLFCLVATLAGCLVWLIRSGKIPGIYGYKIQDADMEGVQNSPFYRDRWTVSNHAGGDS